MLDQARGISTATMMAALLPQHFTDATLHHIFDHLCGDGLWVFVSADRIGRNDDQNRAHCRHLFAFFETGTHGHAPVSVCSYYETSGDIHLPDRERVADHLYFTSGLTKEQVAAICKEAFERHDQDSVLWGNFKDGTGVWMTSRDGTEEQLAASDSFNVLNGDEVWTRFRGPRFKFERLCYEPCNHISAYGWMHELRKAYYRNVSPVDQAIALTAVRWLVDSETIDNWPKYRDRLYYADMPAVLRQAIDDAHADYLRGQNAYDLAKSLAECSPKQLRRF